MIRSSSHQLRLACFAVFLAFASASPAARAISLDWVTVGDSGNAADAYNSSWGMSFGAVSSPYRIMKYEFTTANYVDYLNSVDPLGTNPNSVVNSYQIQFGGIVNTGTINGSRYSVAAGRGNLPFGVSWFQAARVANWLHNGQGSGSTETGAYTLNGLNSGYEAPFVNPGATFFLPSIDQWYKAAYYKGGSQSAGFWTYATQSNTQPSPVSVNLSTNDGSAGPNGNFANAGGGYWNSVMHGNPANVGTSGGPSAYGTFDMSGNVWEWTNRIVHDYYTYPFQWGGAWSNSFLAVPSTYGGGSAPFSYGGTYGFRLASLANAFDTVSSGTVATSAGQGIAVSVATGGVINASAGTAQVSTLAGATLNTGASGATVTTLTSGTINTAGGSVTTQGGTFTGQITGNGGLTKTGTGTLILNSANSFTGNTVINAGTVEIAVGDALGTGAAPIRIANNGKFKALAGVAVTKPVVISSGSAIYEHVLGASDSLTNLAPISNNITTADIVAGDAATTTFTSNFNGNGSISLHGLNGTKFLMVLDMEGYIPEDATIADTYLGWWDSTANSGAGGWVNAVLGNIGTDGSLAGAYTTGYQQFLTANGGWNGTTMLGAYGLDLANQQVWAVIDHNSDFGVTNGGILVVPEPSSYLLAGLGIAGGWWQLRRRRAAANAAAA
jgi:autotransporter-associated beta strand protein